MSDARFKNKTWEALPWEVEKGGTDWNVWGPKPTNHPDNGDLQGDFGSKDEAHLIAAAPEMYQLLEELLGVASEHIQGGIHEELFDHCDKVLAKARGES